jgi:hypothetical protein
MTLVYYPKGKQTQLYTRAILESDNETDPINFGSSLSANKTFNVFKNQLLISKFLKISPK